jgi:hypothetical protein
MATTESWDFTAEPQMMNKDEFDELIEPFDQSVPEEARKSKSAF